MVGNVLCGRAVYIGYPNLLHQKHVLSVYERDWYNSRPELFPMRTP